MDNNQIISVATIVQNDEDTIKAYIVETITILSENFKNYELLLVDNGSSDTSGLEIKKLQQHYSNIRLITLSRKYDDEYAKAAILDNCIGDYLILMDINTDPSSLIPVMIKTANTGYNLVIGERNDRKDDTIFERTSAFLFYRVSKNLTNYNINPYDSDFICMSRKMVNSLIQIRDRNRYLKYLKLEVGYNHTTIKFDRIQRSKKKKRRKLLDTVSFAMEIITTNSDKLLKRAALLGFSISLLNLFYVIYIIGIAIFKNNVAAGWISSSTLNSIMFFFLFLIISIVSIYLSAVLKETKKGSLYYISDESSSSVIYKNIDKKNIV